VNQLDDYALTLGMRREPAKEPMEEKRRRPQQADKILDITGLPPVSAYLRTLRGRALTPFTRSLMVGASGVALYTDKEKAESWYDVTKDPSAKKGNP
jgi:hypothetical protein